jgi:hypothetical protein
MLGQYTASVDFTCIIDQILDYLCFPCSFPLYSGTTQFFKNEQDGQDTRLIEVSYMSVCKDWGRLLFNSNDKL